MTRRIRRTGPPLKVGDTMEWDSQSHGHTTTKRGTIIAVVPPDIEPHRCLPAGYKPVDGAGFGIHRDHESYLIAKPIKCKKAYWPRAYALRVVERKP